MLTSTGLNALTSTFALSNTVSDVYDAAVYSCNAAQNLKTYTMNQLCIHSSRITAASNMAYKLSNALQNFALTSQSNWNYASNTASWASNQYKKISQYNDVLSTAAAAIQFSSNAIAKCASSNGQSNWNWASNTIFKIADRIDNFVERDEATHWDWASNTTSEILKDMSNFASREFEDDWNWASNTASKLQRDMSAFPTKKDAEDWDWASNVAYLASNTLKKQLSNFEYASNTTSHLSNIVIPEITTFWTKSERTIVTHSNVIIKPGRKDPEGTNLLHVDGLTRTGGLVVDSYTNVMTLNRGFYLNFMDGDKDGEVRYGHFSGPYSLDGGAHVWGKIAPTATGTSTMDNFQEHMRLTGTGNLGLGLPLNARPQAKLHVNGVAMKSGNTSWTSESDRRIKENIVSANLDVCYDNIKKIPLRFFNWKQGIGADDRKKLGWIAQEVEPIFPKAVTSIDMHGIPDCRTLNTDQIIATMYGTIQKLQNMVEELQEAARADREAIAQLRGL
jgi:hypothetical protein